MGSFARLLTAFTVLGPIFAAAPNIPLTEYGARREALRKVVGDSVVVLFGNTENSAGDARDGFFQEPNFYYLTGWNQPGAMLVLTPTRDMLLIPRRDPVQERWTGPKAAPGDADLARITGFANVMPTESFESKLTDWLSEGKTLSTLTASTEKLRRLAPLREVRPVDTLIARMRMLKTPSEMAMIQFTTDVDIEAHRAAWKAIRAGKQEYEVAAVMTNVYFSHGCERHAYSPIVGSGPNAAVLHYFRNKRQMDNGELVLMDVGPECNAYATDITRTVPVTGKFTARQRELYDVVLGAWKAALAAVKPGVMLGHSRNPVGLHKIAYDYINTHGKDLKGEPLGKYFIHGLGHHVGLEVHDANDPSLPLAAGMVITLEPGIYIPDEGIGIRIEDMVLVTEKGARVLSDALPREAVDIEKAMAQR